MNIVCPCCASRFPLEAGYVDDDGKRLAALAGTMHADLWRAALPYLRLHKPGKGELTNRKALGLLDDLAKRVKQGTIKRGANPERSCPIPLWVQALDDVTASRDRLTLPLKGNGYLYTVAYGLADKASGQAERTRDERLRKGWREAPAEGTDLRQIQTALSELKGRLDLGLVTPEQHDRERREILLGSGAVPMQDVENG